MLRQLKLNLNLSIGFLNFSRIVVKFVKKTKEVEYEYAVFIDAAIDKSNSNIDVTRDIIEC